MFRGFVDPRLRAHHVPAAARRGAVHRLEEPLVEFAFVNRTPETILDPAEHMGPGCIAEDAQRVSCLLPKPTQYRGPSDLDPVPELLEKAPGDVHAFCAVGVHFQSDLGIVVQQSHPE